AGVLAGRGTAPRSAQVRRQTGLSALPRRLRVRAREALTKQAVEPFCASPCARPASASDCAPQAFARGEQNWPVSDTAALAAEEPRRHGPRVLRSVQNGQGARAPPR